MQGKFDFGMLMTDKHVKWSHIVYNVMCKNMKILTKLLPYVFKIDMN